MLVLPDNYILVSFDVVSLFTNVTHSFIKKIILKNWHTISAYTLMNKATFLTLIDFLFESIYFVFNGKTYQQVEGITMGGIVSPALAALAINEFATIMVNQLPFVVPFINFMSMTRYTKRTNERNITAVQLILWKNSIHGRGRKWKVTTVFGCMYISNR